MYLRKEAGLKVKYKYFWVTSIIPMLLTRLRRTLQLHKYYSTKKRQSPYKKITKALPARLNQKIKLNYFTCKKVESLGLVVSLGTVSLAI